MLNDEAFTCRPALAFRIGITGTRVIGVDAEVVLHERLAELLGGVKAKMAALAAAPRTAWAYAGAPVELRFLSPLAEGADRLGARIALSLGYRLEVPLPFAQAEYEKDFGSNTSEFRGLIAQAGPRVLALDGARGEDETRSYEAAGRLVVHNCDLLIAIWDGGKGKGRGGTAEIVRYAARHGLPVWWLRADGTGEPRWIEHSRDIRSLDRTPAGAMAWARLEQYLQTAIAPPDMLTGQPDALGMFVAEQPPPERAVWTVYHTVMRLAAGRRMTAATAHETLPPETDVWTYWQRFFSPLDRLAVGYGNRYRSSYILVFALAALALSFAALGFGFRLEALVATILELLCLVGIVAIVRLNVSRCWHQRLISYRLLAELFRKQQGLAMFGWSLPVTANHGGSMPNDLWAGWYFNAALRAAPLPYGPLGAPYLGMAFRAAQNSLVTGQAAYHARRRHDSEAAARRFGQLGRGFFGATLLIVLIKCLLLIRQQISPAGDDGNMATTVLRFFLGLLPGISAGFVGIRGYAELELLADQSAQMQRLMETAEAVLQNITLDAPLASQEIGAEFLLLAENMLLDIKGWMQLIRVKTVEPG